MNGSTPMSTSRVMVSEALLVWTVDSTRCPVSDDRMAISAVCRSRISPTMMMLGSCLKKAFRAAVKVVPPSSCTAT